MNQAELRGLVKEFRFKDAFLGLGWNASRIAPFEREIGAASYRFMPIAEQAGVHAFEVAATEGGSIPDTGRRKSIDHAISAEFNRNLIIFVDAERRAAQFQGVVFKNGKRLLRGPKYQVNRPTEPIARFFQLLDIPYEVFDEHGNVAATEVTDRIETALSADKVTKKFFADFTDYREGNEKKNIPGFVSFLKWIEDEAQREWYCSVLINRLMFIYFIAERGFLPGGKQYLANKLAENARANGPDTFYTHFLLPLSFFGLGAKQGERGRFEHTFEGVLYLDGGLFAMHSVEQELGVTPEAVRDGALPEGARIPDAEFTTWFKYFNGWRWTLDEEKYEDQISPHILGYIFEKYINQKQMGAYYTKEDITGYICRNTIVARLFDMLAESGEKGARAVSPLPIGPHPNLLNSGRGISQGEGIDRYIYKSVKQTELLPTETAYEFEQRQTRYDSILQDFDDGKIEGIDDFITYNLDIEKLALDFVSNIQDPEVLQAFHFRCLQLITVLDPTCGSGAFLFAALNILYPLYNASLSRMRYLIGKATGAEPDVINWGGRLHFDDLEADQSTFADFVQAFPGGSKTLDGLRAEVERINDHPSAEYFIKKSIIVNNLFGVDIMEEAVEICKLRLFLELMRSVTKDDSKKNYGVEPLPDIDFNILAGNTLVGYATSDDTERLWADASVATRTTKSGGASSQQTMDRMLERRGTIEDDIREYGNLLEAWRLEQLGEWKGARITKEQVMNAAELVRPKFDEDLWRLYRTAGLAAASERGERGELTLAEFKRSHQPFHWPLEFPSIGAAGGFDAIVGNPPFVEWTKVQLSYRLLPEFTLECGNLYSFIVERCIKLFRPNGRYSMIVPVSLTCTDRMIKLCRKLVSLPTWLASFDMRPAALFSGVAQRLTIFLCKHDQDSNLYSAGYARWSEIARATLFESIFYAPLPRSLIREGMLAKVSSKVELAILTKMAGRTLANLEAPRGTTIYVHRIVRYFIKAFSFVPHFWNERNGAGKSEDYKPLVVATPSASFVGCLLNSSLCYWHWHKLSDGFHFGYRDIRAIGIGPSPAEAEFTQLFDELMVKARDIAVRKQIESRSIGRIEYDEFRMSRLRLELNNIDEALAKHYGLSEEELAFILNYDGKFRYDEAQEMLGE